jgi:hypothetical protein
MRYVLAMMTVLMGAAPLPAGAAGMRTKFGEVVVQGLKIGQTYSLKDLVNLPYSVVNTGDEEVEILVSTLTPRADELKSGYAATPSSGSWVTLAQQRFVAAPQTEVASDITIAIPNDPALLGRRFQADIWARTRSPRGMLAAGMRSRLLIHVDSVPPTEDELKKKFTGRRLANLDFTLLPTHGTAQDVPLGVKLDLRKERKLGVKIINPNEQALHFRIRSIPNWESLLGRPEGFEDAYDARWVKPAQDVVEVGPNSIVETALLLEIPDMPETRNKKFFFSIGVEVLEAEIATSVYYKLYVHTAGGKDAKKP